MADENRRNFLKRGATAVLGVGTAGVLAGAGGAGCTDEATLGTAADELSGLKFALNDPKYRQLTTYPEVRAEFVAALDEVADGLLADPEAYAAFMETSDAVGCLRVWDANAAMLTQLVGPTDGTNKRGRLKRILTVSELYDGIADLSTPGFLDAELSSGSSGGGCATNGSATNGCCVIHTWGWSKGEGQCSGVVAADPQPTR